MNKHKLKISNWIEKLSGESRPCEPQCSRCDSQEAGDRAGDGAGDGAQFYEYFLDDSSSYSPEQYSFSPGLTVSEAGAVSGSGRVTRRGTWVWPHFSGWTSWADVVAGGGAGLHSLTGNFTDGVLCGEARLRFCNDVTFLLRLQCGRLEGLSLAWYQDRHLVWAGRYHLGRLAERSCSLDWESGALLWGETTFLYPDMATALTGVWSAGQLVTARQAEVETVEVGDDGLLDIVCSQPTGPDFSYSPSGPDSFGASEPGLRDPYEEKYIRVRESDIEGGGEGVFAVQDLQPASLAAVFNGYKVPLCSGADITAGLQTLDEVYERLAYNIHMPEDETFYIDFPPSQARLSVYSASLGHKVNHSFKPNCVFGSMFHPRWGRVRTVVTTSEVRRGEELLVDYGYDLLRCPDWYRDMWTATIGAETGLHYWEYRK